MIAVDVVAAASAAQRPEETQQPGFLSLVLADVDGHYLVRAGAEVALRRLHRALTVAAQGAVVEEFPAVFDGIEDAGNGAGGADCHPHRGQPVGDVLLGAFALVPAHAAAGGEDQLAVVASGNDLEPLRPGRDVSVHELPQALVRKDALDRAHLLVAVLAKKCPQPSHEAGTGGDELREISLASEVENLLDRDVSGEQGGDYRTAAGAADGAPALQPCGVNGEYCAGSGKDGFGAAAAEDEVHVLRFPPRSAGCDWIAHSPLSVYPGAAPLARAVWP